MGVAEGGAKILVGEELAHDVRVTAGCHLEGGVGVTGIVEYTRQSKRLRTGKD